MQLDIVEAAGFSDPLISKTYTFPKSQELVHDTAHAVIKRTMDAGQHSNGLGSWLNKHPLEYHAWKGFKHACDVHTQSNINAREREEPHLLHIDNAITRFCMAKSLAGKLKEIIQELED